MLCALALVSALAACGPVKLGRGQKKIVSEDFAEGRVVDLSITEKLTGNREMLFLSMPKKTMFLDGYIQGVVTDYQDNPVQGVVVRAAASGEGQIAEGESSRAGFAGTSFDPGVSDTNGFYRIRFSLPILSNVVDVRGRILYNPGWEQEKENLGKAYEPQTKQSQFRLYYERKKGRITFTEGIRKSVVMPSMGAHAGRMPALPCTKPPAAAAEGKPAGEKAAGGDEDLFKGFGFGQ